MLKKTCLILSTILVSESFAQSQKQTIGQFLNQASRGGTLQPVQKPQTALPSADLQKSKSSVDLGMVKPPKNSTFYNESDDKAKLEQIMDEQIHELYQLTTKYKTSPRRGELWLRLAELYVEKASIIDFRKQSDYDVRLKEYQAGHTKVKPKLDLTQAKEYNRKAIQLYEWFVRDFPKDEKIPQALFFLGYNHYELGDLKKGTSYYTRLTTEYPNSPYVIESNFALAEYYFEGEKWSDAKVHYAKVTQYPKHRLYMFSLYKEAWSYFRSGDSKTALKLMENLIRRSAAGGDSQSANGKVIDKNKLENEGLRDIVLFYADGGSAERAPAYFQALVQDQAPSYLEKLAYLYADRGNIEGAKRTFNYLIDQNLNSPKAFEYKYQIVQLYFNNRNSNEFKTELFSWIRNYATNGPWYNANVGNKALIEKSFQLRETTLRNYILQQHQTAQNSRAPFSQKTALDGYKLYFAEFPQTAVSGEMHFYSGELLYDMAKYTDAGKEYRWVVENTPTNKFAPTAAENSVLAVEKGLPSDAAISAKVGKSVDPIDLDPNAEAFVDISKWYLAKYPNSPKSPEIKFRIGRLYYQYNHFDQAIAVFKEVVKTYPNTKYAEYSANLLLDIFNLQKNYDALAQVGAELLQVPSIANSKAGADIRSVLEKANFKKAQDLEQGKDYGKSARLFEQFAKQNPNSSLSTTATYDAAVNYERAGQTNKAMSMYALVVQSNKKDAGQFKTQSRKSLAKFFQDTGQLQEAATSYEAAARETSTEKLKSDLYYNSAILFQAIDQKDNSIKDYKEYIKIEKKKANPDVYYNMAEMYASKAQYAEAISSYEQYLSLTSENSDKVAEVPYKIYQLAKKQGKPKMMSEWRAKTLEVQKRVSQKDKNIGLEYVAKIKFDDSLETFNKMKEIKLPANPIKQQQAAKNKIDMLSKLTTELGAIIKYDSAEEIVNSLTILGLANLNVNDSLMNAPLPQGLNAEESAQYKQGVQKLADPFKQKAKESLKAAVARAIELQVYNSYYFNARQVLATQLGEPVYETKATGSKVEMLVEKL